MNIFIFLFFIYIFLIHKLFTSSLQIVYRIIKESQSQTIDKGKIRGILFPEQRLKKVKVKRELKNKKQDKIIKYKN